MSSSMILLTFSSFKVFLELLLGSKASTGPLVVTIARLRAQHHECCQVWHGRTVTCLQSLGRLDISPLLKSHCKLLRYLMTPSRRAIIFCAVNVARNADRHSTFSPNSIACTSLRYPLRNARRPLRISSDNFTYATVPYYHLLASELCIPVICYALLLDLRRWAQ